MPVLIRKQHADLMNTLVTRWENLVYRFTSRDLASTSEGAKKGYWSNPENLCATKGNSSDLRLAVSDFKAILDEIKRLS